MSFLVQLQILLHVTFFLSVVDGYSVMIVKVIFFFPAYSSCSTNFSLPNVILLPHSCMPSTISFISNPCRVSFSKRLCSGPSIRGFLFPVGLGLRTSLEREQWVFSVFLQKMEEGPWLCFQRRSSLMRLEINLLENLFFVQVVHCCLTFCSVALVGLTFECFFFGLVLPVPCSQLI